MLPMLFISVYLMVLSCADATSADHHRHHHTNGKRCTISDNSCKRVATAKVSGAYGVSGCFKFISAPEVEEVVVLLTVSGLGSVPGSPAQLFTYHVHTDPVGAGNNCTSTLGHLNPTKLPDTLVCDPENLTTCEHGDLSGKHGKLSATGASIYAKGFVDTQLRFAPPEYSMVGRSVVIHDEKKNRIACGNVIFEPQNLGQSSDDCMLL